MTLVEALDRCKPLEHGTQKHHRVENRVRVTPNVKSPFVVALREPKSVDHCTHDERNAHAECAQEGCQKVWVVSGVRK